jgi:hypothetical protein
LSRNFFINRAPRQAQPAPSAEQVLASMAAPKPMMPNDALRLDPATAPLMRQIGQADTAKSLLDAMDAVEHAPLNSQQRNGLLDYLAARTATIQIFAGDMAEQQKIQPHQHD